MFKRRFWMHWLLVALLVLLPGLIAYDSAALWPNVQAAGEPIAHAVERQLTGVLYPPTALTSSGTVNTASPRFEVTGRDLSKTTGYANADVFIKIDLAITGTVTATVQVGAVATDWATADYEWGDSDSINTQSYQRVMTADGVEVIRLPLAGEYMRVQLAHSAAVTPTIWVSYRN